MNMQYPFKQYPEGGLLTVNQEVPQYALAGLLDMTIQRVS